MAGNSKLENPEQAAEELATSSAEIERRNFMKKYGKLAAVTPLVVTTLMSPSTSAAPKSCRQNGRYIC